MRRAAIGVCWAALAAAGCGDAASAPEVTPAPAPARTAAQDLALRRMARDLAAHQACPALEGAFVALPEDPAPPGRRPRVQGRLWVQDCRAEVRADALRLTLRGRGWRWVDEARAGPLGSAFEVRGVVRLEASVTFTGELDLRYDEARRRAQVLVTPTRTPRAQITPVGALPVAPAGGWSSLLGGLGELLGAPPEAEARAQLEAEAARRVQRQLAGGLTVTLELCTGQVDPVLGALAPGEAPPPPPLEGGRWIDNAEVDLHPGALDVAGPFTADDPAALRADVEPVGAAAGAVRAALVCADEARALAGRYLGRGEAEAPAGAVSLTERRTLRAPGCASAHLVLVGGEGAARVRYRVRVEGVEPEALVACE